MTRAEHLEKAGRCGDQVIEAIRQAMTKRHMVMEGWDYYEEQAVRMSRLAAWHAFSARPSIKPPDRYQEEVEKWNARTKASA